MTAESQHATLVSVSNQGVLIRGAPGVGKSSLALQLLKNGAALIADDLTWLKAHQDYLMGYADPHYRGQIAIRGIGIIDVAHVFGASAFRNGEQRIDWIADLGTDVLAPTPEHDQITLCGVKCPRLSFTAHSNAAFLIELCCQLGSDSLHQWKNFNAAS